LAVLYTKWLVLFEINGIAVNENLDVYALLLKEFTRILTAFLGRYDLRLSQYVIERYLLTLRLYRHECSHIARAISSRNRNDYRNLINKVRTVKECGYSERYNYFLEFIDEIQNKNLEAVCDDVDANIKLIVFMADTIGLLTGRISCDNLDTHEKRSTFHLKQEIIKKCTQSYKNDYIVRQQNKRILVHEKGNKIIFHRKRLLDMVIYNLIDNALKYSHWGTNIRILIGFGDSSTPSAFPLLIENYGSFIESEPKAYEMYYRGSNQVDDGKITETARHVDGDGLGLYVIKTVSDMLGLKVNYHCENISKYNVGLIDEYVKRGKDLALVALLHKERTLKKNLYDKIINMEPQIQISDVRLSSKRLEKYISHPTYRVSFELHIKTKSDV
jgi:signal transduction histidine kinase